MPNTAYLSGLPLNIDVVQILLHMLNFVILAGVLGLLVYKPAAKFLSERRRKIETSVRENERAAEENRVLRAEYEEKLKEAGEEAAKIRQDAEKDAAKIAADTINAANAEAARIIAAAEKEAEERKAHILDSAQTEIGELVIEATQKLLCGTASPERASELYDAFIKTLQDKDK